MVMTHYMELLAANQPWNLIFFMVIPVVLAEALVAAEFFIMYRGNKDSAWQNLSKFLGILAGVYFTGIFAYLAVDVVPTIQWRGYADVIAVGAYMLGVIPLAGIALLELGFTGRGLDKMQKLHRHFMLLIGFLVVSHVAMVFGMVDPSITGWQNDTPPMQQMDMHSGHNMSK